jgi:hypothetical protein
MPRSLFLVSKVRWMRSCVTYNQAILGILPGITVSGAIHIPDISNGSK